MQFLLGCEGVTEQNGRSPAEIVKEPPPHSGDCPCMGALRMVPMSIISFVAVFDSVADVRVESFRMNRCCSSDHGKSRCESALSLRLVI
jgi:hypothetical protein